MLESLARNWWVLFVRGIAAILFGILAFAWPQLTLWALVVMFGIFALADGLSALYLSFTGRVTGNQWWWMLVDGLLGIAAGVIALIWPQISATALLIVIAAWAIVHGVIEIVAAIQLRRILDDEWFLALSGVISILFGIALMLWPAAGLLALVWLIGVFAVAMGITFVLLSLRLRSLNRGMMSHT